MWPYVLCLRGTQCGAGVPGTSWAACALQQPLQGVPAMRMDGSGEGSRSGGVQGVPLDTEVVCKRVRGCEEPVEAPKAGSGEAD